MERKIEREREREEIEIEDVRRERNCEGYGCFWVASTPVQNSLGYHIDPKNAGCRSVSHTSVLFSTESHVMR